MVSDATAEESVRPEGQEHVDVASAVTNETTNITTETSSTVQAAPTKHSELSNTPAAKVLIVDVVMVGNTEQSEKIIVANETTDSSTLESHPELPSSDAVSGTGTHVSGVSKVTDNPEQAAQCTQSQTDSNGESSLRKQPPLSKIKMRRASPKRLARQLSSPQKRRKSFSSMFSSRIDESDTSSTRSRSTAIYIDIHSHTYT